MTTNNIIIKNAHTNNLKNVDVELPKHSIVVFTGVSGSGKSSLLFDTIYTEAQRLPEHVCLNYRDLMWMR